MIAKAIFATLMAMEMVQPRVLLPVARVGNQGNWAMAEWPQGGCKDCAQQPEDSTAYEDTIDALTGNKLAGDTKSVEVHMIRFARGTLPLQVTAEQPTTNFSYSRVSMRKVATDLAGCKIQSEGLLRPLEGVGVSYGVQLACPGKPTAFLSINLQDHKVKSVFYMPDRPFFPLIRD